MAVLAEITELLRRWDVWKRIESAPDKIDELEKRLAALEQKLHRAPGEACPRCGALEFRTDKVVPTKGHFSALNRKDRHLKCGARGHTEVHME
jgi:hypothetical protein